MKTKIAQLTQSTMDKITEQTSIDPIFTDKIDPKVLNQMYYSVIVSNAQVGAYYHPILKEADLIYMLT